MTVIRVRCEYPFLLAAVAFTRSGVARNKERFGPAGVRIRAKESHGACRGSSSSRRRSWIMSFNSWRWLRSWLAETPHAPRRRSRRLAEQPTSRGRKLRLEHLEERRLLAVVYAPYFGPETLR